jgi:hypothetical protein
MLTAAIVSALAAATVVLSPLTQPPNPPPPPLEGVVMQTWYESATPEGILRMPTGPECYGLAIDTGNIFATKICVPKEVWDRYGLFSYYRSG